MKRGFIIPKDEHHKFMTIAQYLFDTGVDFEAHYSSNGDSVISFDCDDAFYELMLLDIPRIHSGENIIGWR